MLRYMRNQSTDATAEVFSGLVDFRKKSARILQRKNPFVYPAQHIVTALKDTVLSIFNGGVWRTFVVNADTDLGAASLDTGTAFVVGTDYYVYLVDDESNGKLVVSANSSFPSGQNANNSRKIGGFHFGHVRCTNDRHAPVSPNGTVFGADGAGWQQNVTVGIVPNSVWDLHNRPLCSPEGMALVGNIWIDIYPSSAAQPVTYEPGGDSLSFVVNGLLQSKYGQLPAVSISWFAANELAARSGKRLLTYGEWVRGAYGNPGGQDGADDCGWTKKANTSRTRTGCQANGSGQHDAQSLIKRFAISAYNLCDCVGNVWEWVDELSARPDGTWSWVWRDVLGADKGRAYLQNDSGLAVFLCGGSWAHGVNAGPRSVILSHIPQAVFSSFGVRLACDKLAG